MKRTKTKIVAIPGMMTVALEPESADGMGEVKRFWRVRDSLNGAGVETANDGLHHVGTFNNRELYRGECMLSVSVSGDGDPRKLAEKKATAVVKRVADEYGIEISFIAKHIGDE